MENGRLASSSIINIISIYFIVAPYSCCFYRGLAQSRAVSCLLNPRTDVILRLGCDIICPCFIMFSSFSPLSRLLRQLGVHNKRARPQMNRRRSTGVVLAHHQVRANCSGLLVLAIPHQIL